MTFIAPAKLCSIAATFLFAVSSFAANSSALENYYKHFKSGNYPKAIDALAALHETNQSASKAYLLGLAHSRLQEYDKAIKEFSTAIELKHDARDLYYEYGQALYAANELKKSRSAFVQSSAIGFNRPAALYYVAHISQILEEFEAAKDNYLLVLKDKDTDNKMKQIAQFQLAETLLSLAREKSPTNEDLVRRVDKFILPMMRTSHKIDQGTPVAYDIVQRMNEIMQEFELDPDQLANGRRLSPKRYNAYLTQRMKFDDNITLTNEENNVLQTKKESYVFETEAYGKYDFVLKKRFLVSPEARLTYTEHGDQSSPEVFTNDSLLVNLNLKNKYEHKLLDRPASLILDLDFAKTYKDWQLRKKRDFYSDSYTVTLGEAFSYFSLGDTSIKVKRKAYRADNDSLNNNTTTVTADQTIFFPIQHLLIVMIDASFIDNFNNKTTNTNTFLTRFDYLIPEIFPTWTLGLALATTITDTLDQKDARGTEVTLNPSIDLSKEIGKFTKISFNLDHSENKSKSTSYDYDKNVFTTELKFIF